MTSFFFFFFGSGFTWRTRTKAMGEVGARLEPKHLTCTAAAAVVHEVVHAASGQGGPCG